MSPLQRPEPPRIPVVGIGASAGGLEALQKFFQSVPRDLGVAYVVIVHLAPDHGSELPAILARETTMPVHQVGDHDKVDLQRDSVYVIAPDRKLEMTDTSVGASRFDEPRGRRAAIDVFFRSLAAGGGDIYAVILSGGGADGSLGAKAVKEAGGLVLVQEPREAAHESMPRAAIATGAADLVLPVRELAQRLGELVRGKRDLARLNAELEADQPAEQREQAALERVLDLLRRRTGHDFSKYKRNTVLRRLTRRMQLNHSSEIGTYLRYLEENVEEVQALFHDLLITVTTFFRNPDSWATLQREVLELLVERATPGEAIRCWIPGCATGEEAYSLAILFAEVIERRKVERELLIFASDVDERALAIAREGVYPCSIAADVAESRLERWFRPLDDHVRIAAELREKVVFAVHSLQRDPPFSRLDLISCRNLLIYLDRELQERVMAVFRYACKDGAYLFLGGSETADPELFQALSKQHRIYRARDSASGRKLQLPNPPANLPQQVHRSPTGRRAPEQGSAAEAHLEALEEAAPPTILVDDQWVIAHLSESAGRFLQPRGGPATHSVMDSVRPELRDVVIRVLAHAFREEEQDLSPFVGVRFNGSARRVAVLAQPRRRREDGRAQVLLMFLEGGPADGLRDLAVDPHAESERERALLERLRRAEEDAARATSEHRSAEEDLRAVNEELQSLNEEYRSTTEELETSKEELQSINEELQTVNLELKGKLEEISRAHDDLENLMAATDIGTLFLDRDLRIQRFTPSLSEVFNVKSNDRGRPIADITHHLHYDDLDRDARRVLAELAPIEREARSRDGRAFVLRLRPYRTAEDRIEGVVITLVDVTRLKRAESVLRESEERFRALVDASAQTVWTRDIAGLAVEDSPSWRAYTGQSYEELKGWGWIDAIHPDDRERVAADWRGALERPHPLMGEFRLHHAPSGEHRWTSVRAVPLRNEDGRVRGWVGMNIDVHERAVAERELKQADARKDEFLAMLGHELRNPLAAIRSSIELATLEVAAQAASTGSEALRQTLAIIDRQSRHMTRLVGDLLDITRITRDKLELQRAPTELRPCLEEVVESLWSCVESAGLQLELRLPPEPLDLDADPERLVQVLDNLLRNAISYTARGGRITIDASCEGERARVTLRDTGIGFEPDQAEALFEPYRQQGSARSGGLGLGLALVKRLVELHGGTIVARSDGPGQGSEFELCWPLAGDAAPSAPRPTAQREVRRPERRRLLVVDDEVDVADSLAALLGTLGQDVRVAYDGERALALAEEHRPELAILDLAMPGMSGRELARRLRAHHPESELVLVALSGHGPPSETGSGGPFARQLLKPVAVEALLALLETPPPAGSRRSP